MIDWLAAVIVGIELVAASTSLPAPLRAVQAPNNDLNRVAVAVEGMESSHGANPAMWRPNLDGPQGPMQVSRAAAQDAGGGNRFDLDENRQLGRSYLAVLFRRYGSWPDAVIAYNWGPGNFERWVAAGRPTGGISVAIAGYLDHVMAELRGDPPKNDPKNDIASAIPPVAPPEVEIHDPRLRKTYLGDRAEIARLRGFLASASPEDEANGAVAVLATMHSVAKRRGYEEFAAMRGSSHGTPLAAAGLREIASVLVGKLEAECAAIALIDQQRQHASTP
ncbi:MAG: lytic transglycosylase domain-containing protein [Stellaceae bacterium]